MTIDGIEYLLIEKSLGLPKIFNSIFLDKTYISKYVKEGTISNELDIESIENHLINKLFPELILKLETVNVLSSV